MNRKYNYYIWCLKHVKKTIWYIVKNKGDYVALVKANQGNLYEDMITYFDINESRYKVNYYYEKGTNHSLIEIKTYYLISDVEWISNNRFDNWSNDSTLQVYMIMN